jgi:hypothetical protein
MSIFQTMKLANSLDFDKLGAAIPSFILKKIREKFNATKTLLDSKLVEGEKRPALILYESDGGKFAGLWVTLDADGFVKRKMMVQDIEALAQVENGGDLFSLVPEIMESAGQKMPPPEATETPSRVLLTEPTQFTEDGIDNS